MPVYNSEKYLKKAVMSVLNQEFEGFELILVDDGSPDNCPKICDNYAKTDNRIHVIHKDNGGVSDARNKGLEYVINTQSKWVTFIDGDDSIHPDYLNSLYNLANRLGIKIVGCFCDRNKKVNKNKNEYRIINPESFWITNMSDFVVPWGKLIDKSLLILIKVINMI